MVGAGITRTKTKRGKDAGNTDTTGLSGWDGIEAHVADNDHSKMQGYSEDIDTLLVFAGLFSAILTAFAVQTYPLLQPSTTDVTNQLLAANNRMLVQGFVSLSASVPFVPPPTLALEDSPPFEPPTSARWINCLFFVSIVLSLAAALFGILVKQWAREFMQWNSLLASPRENVLVRQYRFESWETWNVSTVISTVPALLEIAMILFLIGVIILLWTLDNVVAICVTAIACVFLLVISIFTVLPVVFRRCPYKSPTAWACVLACKIVSHTATYCAALYRYYVAELRKRDLPRTNVRGSSSWRSRIAHVSRHIWDTIFAHAATTRVASDRPRWKPLPRGWRDIDLVRCRRADIQLGTWVPPVEEVKKVAAAVLSANLTYGAETSREAAIEALVTQVKESSLLLRALAWVTKSSQNSHVVTYVGQCSQIESGQHGRSLKCLLDLCFSIDRHRISSESTSPRAEVDSDWRIFLLQFPFLSKGQFPISTCPGFLLDVYVRCMEHYRVTMPENSKYLVIKQGHTRLADYESVLMRYFAESDFEDNDEDRLQMFIFTATAWVKARRIMHAPLEITTKLLGKMKKVADNLPTVPSIRYVRPSQFGLGEDRNTANPDYRQAIPSHTAVATPASILGHPEPRVGHLSWLLGFTEEREALTNLYGAEYRGILHALEAAFERRALRGDQERIRNTLHRQLQTSHAHADTKCDLATCRWMRHKCTDKPPYKCELLAHTFSAQLLWQRAARIVRDVVKLRRPPKYRRRHQMWGIIWVVVFTRALIRRRRLARDRLLVPPATPRRRLLSIGTSFGGSPRSSMVDLEIADSPATRESRRGRLVDLLRRPELESVRETE